MRHSQIFVTTMTWTFLPTGPFCCAALGHDEFAQADLVICDLYSRRVSPAHRSIAGSRADHARRRHRWAAGRRRRLSEKARNPADDRLFRMQDVRDPLTRLERLSS